jgi:hypothetical protein
VAFIYFKYIVKEEEKKTPEDQRVEMIYLHARDLTQPEGLTFRDEDW